MVKGRPLPQGGTIGVVAPASPYYNRSAVLRGVEWWESKGYRVKLAPGIYERSAYLAGDARSRTRDLEAMFTDPDVDAIQCFQGGFGSAEVLDHLDLGVVRDHPKPFVGKSDITSLHTALVGRAGLATFYGPGLINVNAPGAPDLTRERLLRALTTSEPLGEVPTNPDDRYVRSLGPGVARGVLVGGALWVLALTVGTPWQVDLRGKVLFIEEVGEQPWRLDALLTNLRQARVLDGVAAVVVGELVDCDWRDDRSDFPQTFSAEDVLERHISPLRVPAVYGLPLGHGKNLVTIPLGVEVEVDGDSRRLSIIEPALLEPTSRAGVAGAGRSSAEAPKATLVPSERGGPVTNPRPARRDRGRSTIGVLGVPSSAGARQLGQESTPRLFRDVGVLETLRDAGLTVRDYGNLPVVPFTPDRRDRSSRNLRAVASVARQVSHAVGEIDRDGALPFVIGGDCTISIGVLAGLLEAADDLGLVYLDGDVDLNTPSTTATGILDGMGLAHVLGRGARELSTIGPRTPLLDAERIVVFGYQDAWLDDTERAELSSTGMANFPRSVLRERPENAAAEAVRSLQQRVDRFVVHFDVDVVDHPDLPVADVPHFGGLSLVEAERCLQAFLSATGAAALVLTEFNALQDPKGAAAQALAGGIGRALGSRIGNPPGWRTRQPTAAPSSRSQVGGRG